MQLNAAKIVESTPVVLVSLFHSLTHSLPFFPSASTSLLYGANFTLRISRREAQPLMNEIHASLLHGASYAPEHPHAPLMSSGGEKFPREDEVGVETPRGQEPRIRCLRACRRFHLENGTGPEQMLVSREGLPWRNFHAIEYTRMYT